jgi:hypothetical protein
MTCALRSLPAWISSGQAALNLRVDLIEGQLGYFLFRIYNT